MFCIQLLESFQQSFPALSFPLLPERGDFDLKDVLESPYFFNWCDSVVSLHLGLQWSHGSVDVCYLWQFYLFLSISMVWKRRVFYQKPLLRNAAPPMYIFGKMCPWALRRFPHASVSASCSLELRAFYDSVQPTWTSVSECMYAMWVKSLSEAES